MQVAPLPDNSGVLVWLDPDECDCYRRFVADAEKAGLADNSPRAAVNFVALSVMLGMKLKELLPPSGESEDPMTVETPVQELSGPCRR